MTYTSYGSVNKDITLIRDAQSAHPIKDRGLHFDATLDGYVPIPALMLPHTFAVHSWILLKSIGVDHTIFSKDRDTFGDPDLLRLYINSSDKLEIMMTKDIDATQN